MRTLLRNSLAPALGVIFAAMFASNSRADNLVFNRDLPSTNLNNAAGPDRSNVAWGDVTPTTGGFTWAIGDDFSFGTAGQSYQISDLRVWIVGDSKNDPLSSLFSSLTLTGGLPGTTPSTSPACGSATGGPCLDATGISTISTVNTDGSDPNVAVSPLGQVYQGTMGSFRTLYQVDFQNLNWVVQGGTLYNFFVSGVPGTVGNDGVSPFLAASNAPQSGSEQDGADNLIWEIAQSGSSYVALDQWDKSSDIDVQIFATPEPTSILLLATMAILLGGAFTRRKHPRKLS